VLPAIRQISAGAPGTRVITFTAAPSDDELLGAVPAGAVGYLSRDALPERLPVILGAVLDGEAALPRRLSLRLSTRCASASRNGRP
jgi:DNA-binding NarL/FixJ family response regulator